MALLSKKKKYRFDASIEVREVSNVSFVNAVIFVKVRLLHGGHFVSYSPRQPVSDHRVVWNSHFHFQCKMTAHESTGVLDPCMCRISVRKELRGGKSFRKLGYKDINLAQFAGCGISAFRFILDPYSSKSRQDNSTLTVNVEVRHVSGDPLFKRPQSDEEITLRAEQDTDRDSSDPSRDSLTSSSSGFSSLPRKHPVAVQDVPPFTPGHSRNPSHTSTKSQASSSGASGLEMLSHKRNPSTGSAISDIGCYPGSEQMKPFKADRKWKYGRDEGRDKRFDATRVDADVLVNDLVNSIKFEEQDADTGLQLFIGKDGCPALGSSKLRARMTPGSFEPVTFTEETR